MNKNQIFVLSFVIILTSCLVDNTEEYLKNADFEKNSSTLFVNYKKNPDTSLQQIIILSGVRKNGYGVLININNAVSQPELDSIIFKFKMQDIHATHGFNWQTGDSLSSKARVAIEGAKFTWLLSSNPVNLNDSIFHQVNKATEITLKNGGILVKNSNSI
ncbi:MAG: hypothetical protein R2750_05015 [Bacteroidales bacterium]